MRIRNVPEVPDAHMRRLVLREVTSWNVEVSKVPCSHMQELKLHPLERSLQDVHNLIHGAPDIPDVV